MVKSKLLYNDNDTEERYRLNHFPNYFLSTDEG